MPSCMPLDPPARKGHTLQTDDAVFNFQTYQGLQIYTADISQCRGNEYLGLTVHNDDAVLQSLSNSAGQHGLILQSLLQFHVGTILYQTTTAQGNLAVAYFYYHYFDGVALFNLLLLW